MAIVDNRGPVKQAVLESRLILTRSNNRFRKTLLGLKPEQAHQQVDTDYDNL